MRLLLAEDEKELSRALAAILKHSGYDVECVYDGAEAIEKGLNDKFDAFVLDIMMPKADGITVLKTLRKNNIDSPVLMLTAKAQVEDRIAGLDAGADDYLTKPFSMGELLARIRAMTRNIPTEADSRLQAGNISLNRETFELIGEKSSFRLGNKEFEMMELFIKNKDRELSEEQLVKMLWENDEENEAVCLYVSYLANKLKALNADVEISKPDSGKYVFRKQSR